MAEVFQLFILYFDIKTRFLLFFLVGRSRCVLLFGYLVLLDFSLAFPFPNEICLVIIHFCNETCLLVIAI